MPRGKPTLREAPGPPERPAALRTHVRESVALGHYVTISGRDATHAPLLHIRARLSAQEEPQIVVVPG